MQVILKANVYYSNSVRETGRGYELRLENSYNSDRVLAFLYSDEICLSLTVD